MKKYFYVLFVSALAILASCSGGGSVSVPNLSFKNSVDTFNVDIANIPYQDFSDISRPKTSYVSIKSMWLQAVEKLGGSANDPHIRGEIFYGAGVNADGAKSYIYYLDADTINAAYGKFDELVATSLDIQSTVGDFTVNGELTVTGGISAIADVEAANLASTATVAVGTNLTVGGTANITGLITAEAIGQSYIKNLLVTDLEVTNAIDGYARDAHFGTVSPYETLTVPYISATALTATSTNVDVTGAFGVTGDATITGELNVTDVSNFTGDIEAAADINVQGAIHSYSDIKFKRNIDKLPNILSSLLKLEPKSYDFINPTNGSSSRQIGVVAQDLNKLGYPYTLIVSKSKKGYVVDYTKLSVVAIKGLQEVAEENRKLTDRVNRLERKLAALEYAVLKK